MSLAEFHSEILARRGLEPPGASLRERLRFLAYLLDDIFGELDPARRNALLRHLPPHAQKFITTTHLGWQDSSPETNLLPVLRVVENAVERIT